jgi:dCTP deaminase
VTSKTLGNLTGQLLLETGAGILVDSEIRGLVDQGHLISHGTYEETCLEGSSYDVRVGSKGVVGGDGREIDLKEDHLELLPGSYCGVVSYEKFLLPNQVFARIGSKRALSYDGVILLTGALVDPGYEGHLLFGLYNASQRKIVIRRGKKICNVVFERLPSPSSKSAPSDVNLLNGSLPDAFVDRMANMEVLPWMQISERVKQIEQITKDILDLKARYEDVLKPIRDLTENVNSLTQDVSALAEQSKGVTKDLGNLNSMVTENGRQISQLTANLGILAAQLEPIKDKNKSIDDKQKQQTDKLEALSNKLATFSIVAYVFWGLVLLVLGVWIRGFFGK